MKDELYIIRGTGLALDGTLVTISEWGSDGHGYVSVVPHNPDVEISPIKVMGKYLQPVGDTNEYTYTISILKFDEHTNIVDKSEITIKNTIKNINTNVIKEWINTNLSPLLKD